MRVQRSWQDAGQERLLLVGTAYDLPEAIAHAFIATGVAEREGIEATDTDAAAAAIDRAPESKPDGPPETGRRRIRPGRSS